MNFSKEFRKILKFHENSSSGSRVVPCGRTDGQTDRQTDITKLIGSFRNFANALKNFNAILEKPEKIA
jgi:hypothetical protein